MRKFYDVLKEKAEEHNILQENRVLDDFKKIYSAMLEHYGLTTIHDLNDESQVSFLTELNHYWSEEEGLSEKGDRFLQKRSASLNENSTAVQKKNFLKDKAYAVISETLRQADLKFKLYDVIDEMYKQTKSSNLRDVLSPDTLTSIITDSFVKSLNEFSENINKELKESVVEPKKKFIVRVNTTTPYLYEKEFSSEKRQKLASSGAAMPDGSYPIETVKDLKNAIHAFGRAKNKPATKKHIIKRAKALGQSALIPENW